MLRNGLIFLSDSRAANMLFMTGSVVQESPLGFLWPKGNGNKQT